jgi:hypothetical protein
LRNSTCNSAPASASNPPQAKPASARGSRRLRTTSPAIESAVPNSAGKTSPSGT